MPKRPNPFGAKVVALSDDDFASLTEAAEARKCRESVGVGDFDEAAAKWRPHSCCPKC